AGGGADCADGQNYVAGVPKWHGLPGCEIRSQNAEWNFHILKSVFLEHPFEEGRHSFAAHQSKPAEAPARDVVEAHGAADFADLLKFCAAGIGRGYNSAGAHACNDINGDFLAFQDLQYANVRHTA